MTHRLSPRQKILLGSVVLLSVAIAAFALLAISSKRGLFASTVELTVLVPEAHDVSPGTPVRIRGVDAGEVVAVEYPTHDRADAAITLRLKIDSRFKDRLYADGYAQIHATNMFGSKVIAIHPGTPESGPSTGALASRPTPDFASAAARIGDTADEARQLLRDIRTGQGSLSKLLNDDKLYTELMALAQDSRSMVKRADAAVDVVEAKAGDVDKFVADGRSTLKSVKQGSDALGRLPLVRNYVEDPVAIMSRPNDRREDVVYNTADLFEPNTAILTDSGKHHLAAVAAWLRGVSNSRAEIVVASHLDPNNREISADAAYELTRKQSEVALEYIRNQKGLRTGWITSRTARTLGLGQNPSPVNENKPMPPSWTQILLFTPQ